MIFHLRDYVFAPLGIWREHAFLHRAEGWSVERRRAYTQERLERVLDHAVRRVPYYRETLEPYRARLPDMIQRLDLSELPVLTKHDVRAHYAALVSDDAATRHTTTTETSGSTGTPTRFLLDRESNVHQFAAIWRVLNWCGYRFGQPYADLTGYLPRRDGLSAYDVRTNCLHLSTFNFKKEHMPRYVEMLRRFRPVFIKAYPSAIDLFCRWLRELGIRDFRPKAVLTCAESLLDHQRQSIAEVLACPVFDFYGQNERGALISTCERQTYHVHEEYAYTEFVPTGRDDVTAIVSTPLHNLAMPLIRYRTDDLALVGDQRPCPCGRSYRTVERIVGRVEDVVVTPDGRHIGRLDAAFKYSSGIRMSQVVQASPDEIEVRIVRAADFGDGDLARLEKELRARVGPAIGIRYTFVDDIPPGPNGKLKFMVSLLSSPAPLQG